MTDTPELPNNRNVIYVKWTLFQPDARPYRMNSTQFEVLDTQIAVELPEQSGLIDSYDEGAHPILTPAGATFVMGVLESTIPNQPQEVSDKVAIHDGTKAAASADEDNDWETEPKSTKKESGKAEEKKTEDVPFDEDEDWG